MPILKLGSAALILRNYSRSVFMKLTNAALLSIQNHIAEKVIYATFEEPNGNDTHLRVSEIIIDEEGTLRFVLKANLSTKTTIVALKLYDEENNLWLSQPCDIRVDVSEETEITFWVDFNIKEEL